MIGGPHINKNIKTLRDKVRFKSILVSPNINDEIRQVIIDNSSYILVMAQGQKEIEAVQKMMNLSESEIQFLTTASRGQGLFVISQDTRLPIQIHLREEEKELFGNAGGR
jgi:hypothetical protein